MVAFFTVAFAGPFPLEHAPNRRPVAARAATAARLRLEDRFRMVPGYSSAIRHRGHRDFRDYWRHNTDAATNEENMTELSRLLSAGICALCGKGVHIDDHEGRVACDGCNMATDNCDCASKS